MEKYSTEQTEYIKKMYLSNPTKETVSALALEFDKPVRSIVGKLSKEGIYKRPVYRSKTGEIPINKDEIVEYIAKAMNAPSTELEGLEKAPKAILKRILFTIDPAAKKHFVDDQDV